MQSQTAVKKYYRQPLGLALRRFHTIFFRTVRVFFMEKSRLFLGFNFEYGSHYLLSTMPWGKHMVLYQQSIQGGSKRSAWKTRKEDFLNIQCLITLIEIENLPLRNSFKILSLTQLLISKAWYFYIPRSTKLLTGNFYHLWLGFSCCMHLIEKLHSKQKMQLQKICSGNELLSSQGYYLDELMSD